MVKRNIVLLFCVSKKLQVRAAARNLYTSPLFKKTFNHVVRQHPDAIRVNDYVIFAAGFPKLQNTLAALGYNLIELEMSEFQKMDGGLSCLSLRF